MSTYGRKPLDETHAAAWQEGHDDGFRAGVEAAATYLNGWHGYTISVATVANIRSLAPERAERGEGDDWGYKCPECGIDVCNHTVLAHHKLKAEIERLSPPAPPASGAPPPCPCPICREARADYALMCGLASGAPRCGEPEHVACERCFPDPMRERMPTFLGMKVGDDPTKPAMYQVAQPAPPASGAPRCANGHVLGKGPHFCDACDCACAVHPSGTCDCECRRHPREAP